MVSRVRLQHGKRVTAKRREAQTKTVKTREKFGKECLEAIHRWRLRKVRLQFRGRLL